MSLESNLLTPVEVADLLQLHVLTVYSYIRRGRIDTVRLGRVYRIVPQDLQLFVEANRIKMPSAPSSPSGER